MSNQPLSLLAISDLFRELALLPQAERDRLMKYDLAEEEWQEMENMAGFAAMFSGVGVRFNRSVFLELVRMLLVVQERAARVPVIETLR